MGATLELVEKIAEQIPNAIESLSDGTSSSTMGGENMSSTGSNGNPIKNEKNPILFVGLILIIIAFILVGACFILFYLSTRDVVQNVEGMRREAYNNQMQLIQLLNSLKTNQDNMLIEEKAQTELMRKSVNYNENTYHFNK